MRVRGFGMGVVCVVALGGAGAGCAQEGGLRPAATARVVPGQRTAAVENVSGVTMTVDTRAWSGPPRDLGRVMTPVRVTIHNNSGQPVRIQYRHFELVSAAGRRYTAIPPLAIDQKGPVDRTVTPAFSHEGFLVSPYYSPYYPDLEVWPGRFPYDYDYFTRYRVYWQQPFPTRSMLERALPEGVLEDGGTVSGFLYFSSIPEEEQEVVFRADLVEGQQGLDVASVRIPFVVQ